MREMLLGFVAIGVLAGVALGRTTERARRGLKDYGAAKTAVPKGRQVAMAEMRKAVFTIVVVGGLLVALFIGAVNLPD